MGKIFQVHYVGLENLDAFNLEPYFVCVNFKAWKVFEYQTFSFGRVFDGNTPGKLR